MSRTSSPIPGFSSPAVGFDQPHDMLKACHERVLRSLDLLERLAQHITLEGHDASSRSAAQDVLRYFDLAAPLHHEDEELHLFPLLLERGDQAQVTAVQQLQSDHKRMHAQWLVVRATLTKWTKPEVCEQPTAQEMQDIAAFCAIYPPHIALEESTVYPGAFGLIDSAALTLAAGDMRQRRQNKR